MAIAHPGHTSIYQADGYGQRSISLKDNYFIRSGEADQWADKYAERIQSHLDDLEESFMIGVDNANDPPSIRNIINGIIAYALNQKAGIQPDVRQSSKPQRMIRLLLSLLSMRMFRFRSSRCRSLVMV